MFSASSTAMPHDKSIFSKQYPYEGFRNVSYSTYPKNDPIDQKTQYDIVPPKQPVQPVWGLRGLYGPPDQNTALDIYSTAPGSISEQCWVTSSGYTNSKGYLCMNEEQLKMLTTRGGNQTICQAQIG